MRRLNEFTSARIILREFNSTPPLENNYKINTELNALPKQNIAPEIFKRPVHGILDDFKNFQYIPMPQSHIMGLE